MMTKKDFEGVFEIHEGPWWVAGRDLKWIPMHSMPGIGLLPQYLKGDGEFVFRLKYKGPDVWNGRILSIDRKTAREAVMAGKWFKRVRNTLLAVLPVDMYTIVFDEKAEKQKTAAAKAIVKLAKQREKEQKALPVQLSMI
jgi:hypothetical protein